MVSCCVWVGGAFPDASDHCVIRDFIIMKCHADSCCFCWYPFELQPENWYTYVNQLWLIVAVAFTLIHSLGPSLSLYPTHEGTHSYCCSLIHPFIHSFNPICMFLICSLLDSPYSLFCLSVSLSHTKVHIRIAAHSFIHSFIPSLSLCVCVCVCVCVHIDRTHRSSPAHWFWHSFIAVTQHGVARQLDTNHWQANSEIVRWTFESQKYCYSTE